MKKGLKCSEENVSTLESIQPPWLNRDGTTKSDDEIKILSRDWDSESWESYLRCFTGEENQKDPDEVVSSRALELALDGGRPLIWGCTGAPTISRRDARKLRKLVRLNFIWRQRKILNFIFTDHLTERQIAKRLNVSRTLVHKEKRAALSKLRRLWRA